MIGEKMGSDEKPIVDRTEIETKLRSIGLREGMYAEVHSSLSSFGYVEGGAETTIRILQKIVTPSGAIIMPSFPLSKPLSLTKADIQRGLTYKVRRLSPDSNRPTGMGIIADTFRRMKGVRTGKGLHRVSAWGAESEKNSQGLTNLHEHDGYALLLGVDIYRLTSMHYVEGKLPKEITSTFKASEEILKFYPEDEWYIETGHPPEKAWYKIQEEAYKRGYISDVFIGRAKCMFFKVNKVIGLYKDALERDPFGLYGMTRTE